MRRRLTSCLSLVLASALAASGCSSARIDDAEDSSASLGGKTHIVATLRLVDVPTQMRALTMRGVDVAGVDLHAKEVDVVVDGDELALLEADGFTIVRQELVPAFTEDLAADGYKSPADVEALVRGYAEQFPAIAAAAPIGRSNQGRDIWALRITKDVGTHSAAKPTILFNGMHHARELMTVEVPLDTIETLLTGYGTDPKITRWVDANEIWVVPMLNVDGSNQVWTHDHFWRKNARGCPASGSCPSRTGVDINRNYPYGWGSCNGSSSRPTADNYRGPSAASEPETNAMMGLVDRVRPVFDISYHSYSELVLYPYGCAGQHTPSRAILEDVGSKMAARLPSDDAARPYKHGTPWEILYSADGGDIDWMYHRFSVLPFVIELNSARQGFRPSYSAWRTRTVTKARAAWQMLLDRLDGSGVRGVVRAADGAALDGATVDVALAGDAAGGEVRALNPDGSFHVIVFPGSYRVTVTAPNRAPFATTVDVGAARVDLDVLLD